MLRWSAGVHGYTVTKETFYGTVNNNVKYQYDGDGMGVALTFSTAFLFSSCESYS